MSPTSERLLLRPSVEARVQLDCVELLCVPAEPIPGCQRGLVQDGVPMVVAPSGRTDSDVTHSSPIAAFYPRVMLEVAYPHPTRILSQSIRGQPASRKKALTARAHSTNRPSRVRTAHLRELSCRQRTSGTRMPRTRARANRSRSVADRDGRVHLGGMAEFTCVTARLPPPESRWCRRGRGSSMSHAWAINGPLRMANARYPRLAMSAPGCCTRALSKLSWTSQSTSNDQHSQPGRAAQGTHSGCPFLRNSFFLHLRKLAVRVVQLLWPNSRTSAQRLAAQLPRPGGHAGSRRHPAVRDTMLAPA
jgi:hypothetical protein